MNAPKAARDGTGSSIEPVHVSLLGQQSDVRGALAEVMSALGPLDLNDEERSTVELVLAEVLNNIVEHAYAPPKPVGPIDICCVQSREGLRFDVRDRGGSMPDARLPAGEAAPVNVEFDDLPEGGFGWFIIRRLAEDLTYDRVGDENLLTLRLAIAPVS